MQVYALKPKGLNLTYKRVWQGERNFLMQVVCEATQNNSIDVQVSAFECLVRIMGLYYDKMNFYMERALFGVSLLYLDSICLLMISSVAYNFGHAKS